MVDGTDEGRAPAAPVPRVALTDVVAPAAPVHRNAVRRRRLLRAGFWAGAGVLAAGGLAAAADFLAPRRIQRFGGLVAVPADKVPRPGATPVHVEDRKFWLVNLEPGEGVPDRFQSFAPPSRRGGLLALYEKCPHLGASVPWRSDFTFGGVTGWFRCPSHGATFTKGGVYVYGPAPRSLDTFAIIGVSRAGVVVNTGHLLLGGADDPQRAVPAAPFT